jgi:DNA mismatch repair protein MutS
MAKTQKYPPLIQQFIENQTRYPDAIVATEVGGFFEIWQVEEIGHAIRASQLLDTVLTRRNKSDPNSPYMIGFPSHAAETYFKKLVDLGETVVIVEQNIRGRKADGNKNVTREISKIMSPGTIIDNLKDYQNNYFASLYVEGPNLVGVALVDVSTGEVKISELNMYQTKDFLDKMSPKEILITGTNIFSFSEKQLIHNQSPKNTINNLLGAGKLLSDLYEIPNPTSNSSYSISALGLEFWRVGVLALGNLLNYFAITDYNSKLLKKLSKPEIYSVEKHLIIPLNGMMSLELFESTNKIDSNSLINSLDKCKTAMGRRKLKQWLLTPLADEDLIKKRHDKVAQFVKDQNFLTELKDVYDIARISRKMIFSSVMPHEMSQLYQSLSIVEPLIEKDQKVLADRIKKIIQQVSKNIDVTKAVSYTDKSNYDFFKGNLKQSIDKYFNQWQNAEAELETYKQQLELLLDNSKLRMVEKSESFFLVGPKSIKLKAEQNNILIQEKASDVQILDPRWEQLSLTCFGYKQKFRQEAEKAYQEFQKNFFTAWGSDLLVIAEQVGEIDVLSNFAQISFERGYIRPQFLSQEKALVNFVNLRHPVVELSPKLKESFVSNDVSLDEKHHTLVIYGANSAGKSTILKSVALNIIMAQIGCFVACSEAQMTVFEAILTRMTSFDSLSEGLSTFTMEMTELQVALQNAQKRSIFLFDEIGRGTSVEDGEAIAYSTLVYLDKPENNSITLFATHYHGLYEEIKDFKTLMVKNVHCYANNQGQLVFARKLIDGPGEGSYGIEVAKSCGLPEDLIRVAQRYSQVFSPLKSSHYNKKIKGTVCPICNINPAQQTHHIIEQHQGKVKDFLVNGSKKSINHQSNLIMICASCHEKITRNQIKVEMKKVLGSKDDISLEITEVKKDE